MDTVLWLCPSLPTETLKWLSSLPILMQESFWWWHWQCSDRYIISPFPLSLISLAVPVGTTKHHVYLLTLWQQVRQTRETNYSNPCIFSMKLLGWMTEQEADSICVTMMTAINSSEYPDEQPCLTSLTGPLFPQSLLHPSPHSFLPSPFLHHRHHVQQTCGCLHRVKLCYTSGQSQWHLLKTSFLKIFHSYFM